jgi:hypothetical protein
LKAWEKAYVKNIDKEFRTNVIQADVVTYDSDKDLIYAVGEHGRLVNYAQQYAAGQPASPGSARAVQLNPKTGALHLIESNSVQLIDKNTGVRPGLVSAPDPNAKPKKKPPRPMNRLPYSNIERKGFTGQ